MAPRKAATAETAAPAAPAATAVATTAMKTVQGYTIQLLAFIPVDPKDLRTQAAIPTILLDISEGHADISALMPYLKQTEFRSQNTRKRVTEDEFNKLFAKPETHTAEHTDIDSEGRTEEEREDPPGTVGGAQMEGNDGEEIEKPAWTPGGGLSEEDPDAEE